jgi:6-pyruvoyltetrahydropterin/6-carboxytetrahydropterin synthase
MEVELHSHLLDAQGMVIDFVELKKIISAWVNATLDHSWVVYEKDVTVINALRVIAVDSMDSVRTVVVPFNPTAENVANWLLASVFPALFTSAGYQHVNVLRVSLWETPTSVAHARAVWD